MMLLEMLLCEHPFEGLNDSQIIHRLTIGNVEIPDSIGPEWSLLIKGLLTKDGGKRWEKPERDRWLAGERDIPVFYETPGAVDINDIKPFKFGGASLYTKEDLARAFAASEDPWRIPHDYLRFVRQWLETNLEFEEAADMGGALAAGDSLIELFRFVHSNAELPFGVWGRVVNLDNLYIFLWRETRGEAEETESEIVGMLGGGKLASLYGEYVKLSAPDPAFGELLELLKGEPPARQLDYTAAMRDPGARLWPGDAHITTESERVECMKRILSAPLKLEVINDVKSCYVTPDELWAMFRTSAEYASGADRLKRWMTGELLVPAGPDDDAYKNMSVEGYEIAAKVRMWGHTSSFLKRLNELGESISYLYNERPTPVFIDTGKELEFLRDRKVSDRDLNFLDALSALLSKRQAMRENRRKNWAIYGAAGVGILAALRFIFWSVLNLSHYQLAMFCIVLFIFFGIFSLGMLGLRGDVIKIIGDREARYRAWRSRGNPVAIFIVGFLFFVLRVLPMPGATPDGFIRFMAHAFPLIGAPMGVLISNAVYSLRMERNMDEIMDACRVYAYYYGINSA
jgi:hypothetical protein